MKKKIWIAIAIASVLLVSVAGIAYAQAESPPDADGVPTRGFRHAGVVLDVDLVDNAFVIESRLGYNYTISVDENTRWKSRGGLVTGLSDLQPGMTTLAFGRFHRDEGVWVARVVFVGQGEFRSGPRALGDVTSVGSDSFTIQARSGDELTFQVNDETKFFGGGGTIQSLDDLEVGMIVAVKYEESSDGSLLAKVVAADLPPILFGRGAAGDVTAVGSDSFTILNLSGEEMTFAVNDETRFLSRGGVIQSLADLEVGMKVGVRYQIMDGGDLLAKIVGVKPAPTTDGG